MKKFDIQSSARKIEEIMGLRSLGSCPICDDFLVDAGNGVKKCYYCDWNSKWTPERTCKRYNSYWAEAKEGYRRSPKKVEDFMNKSKKFEELKNDRGDDSAKDEVVNK